MYVNTHSFNVTILQTWNMQIRRRNALLHCSYCNFANGLASVTVSVGLGVANKYVIVPTYFKGCFVALPWLPN